jgi:hypothetical protein
MSQAITLALTALPNGFSGANLRLSVVLTPSISTSDNSSVPVAGTPFDGWTKKVSDHPPSWKVTFTQNGASLDSPNVSAETVTDLLPELWTAIFGGNRHARNRRGNADLQEGWRLSHNISKLHDRHRRLRDAHAHRALVATIAKTLSDPNTIAELSSVHSNFSDDIKSGAPPVIYLFPVMKGDASSAMMTAEIDNRTTAFAAKDNIDPSGHLDPTVTAKIKNRIQHALDILETQEGTRLRALALYSVYRHCIESVAPPTVSLDTPPTDIAIRPLYDIYQTFTASALNLIPILTLQVDPPSNNAGTPVTIRAVLCPALFQSSHPPAGTITFFSNGILLATSPLQVDVVKGTATATSTVTSLPTGTNDLKAVYSGTTGDPSYPAGSSDTLAYSVAAANDPLPTAGPISTTIVSETPQDALHAYQSYVEMLLFHRKKPDKIIPDLPTPDFHQLLGMVNHYPAMLRPLGLAFDLIVVIPANLVDGPCTVQVANPFTDNVFAGMTAASYKTKSQFNRADPHDKIFCADSRNPGVLDRGYLVLDAVAAAGQGSAYSFVQEDADGSALKFSDQANNAARASEYTSSAPTAMTILPASAGFRAKNQSVVPTPASTANPTDAPPAPRTVGISLFHQDKLATLAEIVKNAPPAPSDNTPATPPPPTSLWAEDLMLGIRVDIQRNKRPWQSVCRRVSTYKIRHVDLVGTDPNPIIWSPLTDPEQAADEGFITFAVTQTQMDDGTSQTQLHQSLFTWTGWSMAVQKPQGFQTVNPPNKPQIDGPLSITPTFALQKPALLPALRFNHSYNVRCRVVDLAGNSTSFSTGDTPHQHQVALSPRFSRHEPVRAPQILLTEAIDRDDSPGENIDHMIARDGDEPASRMLIPPRESVRLAELHNMLPKGKRLPDSAFLGHYLMPNGAFPSVQQAHDEGWYHHAIDSEPTHNQDPIFLKGLSVPKNRFYPDPLAHYIRVKPFLVSDDPTLSRPLGENFYVEIDPGDEWPNVFATILGLNAHPDSENPTVDFDNDERPPSITVNLPRGFTVVLEISSAAYKGKDRKWRTDDSKSVALHQFRKSYMELTRRGTSTNPTQAVDLIGSAAAQVRMGERSRRLDGILLDTGTASDVLDDPNSYLNGDLPQMTPPRTVTLVHAVRRPLAPPDFATHGTAGDLSVVRQPGKAKAALRAGISAHWLSTGRVTCHAKWTDKVDDLTKSKPTSRETKDVAFVITAFDTVPPATPDFDGSVYIRQLKTDSTHDFAHAFTDTRAHTVTYTLSAATRFRGYFPLPHAVQPTNPPTSTPEESEYTVDGVTERDIVVKSSVRPPAPAVAYIIPAFLWRDTFERKTRTWFSGRDVLLRVYFARPFLVSGDLESIGVVIATPALNADDKTQPLVSRWGSDPTRPITEPIASSALTAQNLCQPNDSVQTCQLAEGGVADIKPCAVHYAEDRKLWFTDIPINTLGSFGPFVRLALVRWQPQALHANIDTANPPQGPVDPNIDCRISPVVFADFIQLAPDRWVSVQRTRNSEYVVTVSGVFPPPEQTLPPEPPRPTFTLSLYSRWYATGQDTGWRQVDCPTSFKYTPAASDGNTPPDPNCCISSWSTVLKLPHSPTHRKYRILLQENEWYVNSKSPRVTYSQFVDLP